MTASDERRQIPAGQESDAGWPWAQARLFNGLPVTALAEIEQQLHVQAFAAGDLLIQQGVWRGALLIIRTGIVEISLEGATNPDDDQPAAAVSLRRLVAGECIGEMSLITGQAPSATARAITDGAAWILEQADFLQLVTTQPALSRNISAILSERLLHTNRQQADQPPTQVVVGIGGDYQLWAAVAGIVGRLTRKAVLFIDLTETEQAEAPTLSSLLAGRIQAGGPTAPSNNTGGRFTLVRGLGADTAIDLPAVLGRFHDVYHAILVALPMDSSLLTVHLTAYATQLLLVGRAAQLSALRAMIASLPRVEKGTVPQNLGVIITQAPVRSRRAVATLEILEAEIGAPVRAILPASGERYADEIAALGRWLVGQRIGLVLGAGGPKGFAHIGAMRILRQINFPIDVIAGTSVGAIVGGLVAKELPDEQITPVVDALLSTLFRPTVPLQAVLSTRKMEKWARSEQVYGDRLIEELPIPFAASAADLSAGQEIVMRRGRLWQAVMASAAIPGIYPPVMVGQHWLVDGGVVNPVPVSIAQLLGADLVLAVDLSEPLLPRKELTMVKPDSSLRAPYLPETLMRSRDIMMSEIREHTAGEPTLVINPQVRGVSLRNVRDAAPYIDIGATAVEASLPRLYRLMPWLTDTD